VDWDALVIGGGPAGLSAAIQLARYNRRVLVLDSGEGRSSGVQVNHNYLGFPDGVAARELRELGRKQLAAYPHAEVRDGMVEKVVRDDGFFVATAGGKQDRGRTVVLACGVLDDYPEFPGARDFLGRSMFWCITCDGYECRSKQVVVLGADDQAAAEALQLLSLTDRVLVLTDGETAGPGDVARSRLQAAGVPVVEDRLVEASGEDGQLHELRTAGGRALPVDALFVVRGARPRTDLAVQLGVQLSERGYVVVDTEQHTSVKGVLAAGDLTSLHGHQVSTAVHEGAQAACAANYLLYPEAFKIG
jgi:thioredoxin reductase (NADPH)